MTRAALHALLACLLAAVAALPAEAQPDRELVKRLTATKIDRDLNDASAADVLALVARQLGVEAAASPTIRGARVSAKAGQLSLLDALRRAYAGRWVMRPHHLLLGKRYLIVLGRDRSGTWIDRVEEDDDDELPDKDAFLDRLWQRRLDLDAEAQPLSKLLAAINGRLQEAPGAAHPVTVDATLREHGITLRAKQISLMHALDALAVYARGRLIQTVRDGRYQLHLAPRPRCPSSGEVLHARFDLPQDFSPCEVSQPKIERAVARERGLRAQLAATRVRAAPSGPLSDWLDRVLSRKPEGQISLGPDVGGLPTGPVAAGSAAVALAAIAERHKLELIFRDDLPLLTRRQDLARYPKLPPRPEDPGEAKRYDMLTSRPFPLVFAGTEARWVIEFLDQVTGEQGLVLSPALAKRPVTLMVASTRSAHALKLIAYQLRATLTWRDGKLHIEPLAND